MSSLQSQQLIDGRFTVDYLIKESPYCETYRVTDIDGQPRFMKVYLIKRTPTGLVDENDGQVAEIFLSQKLRHKGLNAFVAEGCIAIAQGVARYMVTEYFNGELLAERIQREGPLPLDEARELMLAMLDALHYMHDVPHLLHNDITPRNVMIAPDDGPKIIDMGHVSGLVMGVPHFDVTDLDLHYCSTPAMAGLYTPRNDIFGAVAVFYTMLTGHAPWPVDLDGIEKHTDRIKAMRQARREEPDLSEVPEELHRLIRYGLGCNHHHFDTVRQVSYELRHPTIEPADDEEREQGTHVTSRQLEERGREEANYDKTDIEIKRGNGNGFADIAGMAEMKEMLQKRIIFILKDKERAKRYRLTPPNGLLLYGPPGCGKSFFAEKFAEETGFNFMLVKASDLGSVYIHGTQGKIADLFKKAEEHAPTVICFDEFDAFVPTRSGEFDNKQAGEVNEFLTQLNNCSQRGIFVIATSNRPDMIDPAVLRTGRIDKQVYVPLPDFDARREMLALYMKDRPAADDIDYDALARLTDGYVSSDITYAVNEAAMIAAFNDEIITQQLLETTIRGNKPSVRPETIKQYESIRERMEGSGRNDGLPPIGFK